MLDLARLRASIPSQPVAWEIHYVERTDSTNRVARDLPHGSAVITDYQEAGRGRRGRTWLAPPCSSLLVTAVLDLLGTIDPTDASMIAALAVCDAIRDVQNLDPVVKWPNDIVIDGKSKVAGVLLEGIPIDGGMRVLLGMGINGNFLPDTVAGLPAGATSLQAEIGRPVDREQTIAALLGGLARRYKSLGRQADAEFDAWRSSLTTIGQAVRVDAVDGAWDGEAIDVRRDGALLVRTADGAVRAVLAADVSIRAKE